MRPADRFEPWRLTALVRRRRRTLAVAAAILCPLGALTGALWPLRYESEIIVERKLAQLSPDTARDEFDVTRLTSETQRSVALFKSRYLCERWLAALSLPCPTPAKKERQLRKLARSLSVQPINYTDLFSIKVKADTPEEAKRRVALLTDLFADWDADQNRAQADALAKLLGRRMTETRDELERDWTDVQRLKRRQDVTLSGTEAAKALETEIEANNRLYDGLTLELDAARRRLENDGVLRTRVIAPPTGSSRPVHTRTQLIVAALCLGLIVSFSIGCIEDLFDDGVDDPERPKAPGRLPERHSEAARMVLSGDSMGSGS